MGKGRLFCYIPDRKNALVGGVKDRSFTSPKQRIARSQSIEAGCRILADEYRYRRFIELSLCPMNPTD
jgi:hypothetical protein